MVNIDYLYNPDRAKKFFDKNYFLDKKLGFQVIENGTILPHKDVWVNGKWTWGKGGIIDNEDNFVKNSTFGACKVYTPPTNRLFKALKP